MTANLPSSALTGTGDGDSPPNTFLNTPAIVRREIQNILQLTAGRCCNVALGRKKKEAETLRAAVSVELAGAGRSSSLWRRHELLLAQLHTH